MKNIKYFAVALIVISSLFLGGARNAHAATLSLSSATDVLHIGDTFEVSIKIDTEGAGVNAVQGTLQYPKDILQATKIDRSDSVFDFWLQEPAYSNDTGKVTFVGGSTAGSVGKSLQVLRITFTAKGSGRAEFTFTDSAVTASDGSGTNVLSALHGLVINSVPLAGAAQVAPIPTAIPAPVQITRPAVTASGLPAKPDVSIPLYPNSAPWFNRTDPFLTQWKLPSDVSAVSTALDQNITYGGQASEGLFDSKVFPAIARDGVWYLHVRFKNNVGWGPSNNYRIAVDTHPPLSFVVSAVEGNPTDSPTPTLKFSTKDALSGIKEYEIAIDNGDMVRIDASMFNGTFKLPLQSPGKHRIVVRASDNAENSDENILALDIIPIASPTITFVTQELFSDKQTSISIKGSTQPGTNILLTLHQGAAVVAQNVAHPDTNGNWEFTFANQLSNGTYSVSVRSQDARGAMSLIVESSAISVKSAPIIQLGAFQLGPGGASFLLLLLLIGGFFGGVWFWRKREDKLALRVGFAQSEITKIFKIIAEDVKQMSNALKTPPREDDEYAVGKLEENMKKMEGYIKKGIDKLNK